jgi:glycosyltransferase involved in cell wall biosynthesis
MTALAPAKAARGSNDPAARIRVLRVITRLNVGGPALHTTLLTEWLDPERYDSLLAAGVARPDEGDYLALHGGMVDRLVRVPTLSREVHPTADGAALLELVRFMRRTRPHIVHTHTAKAGALGRLAARLTRVPVVLHTYHGHVFEGYFGPWRTRLFLSVERALARRTDCLLAVSGAVRQDLLALGIGRPEHFRVVPLGLDLDRFLASDAWRGELRAELGLPLEAPLVGIVARLVPIKMHEVFLRAAARVSREVPGSQFIVVGSGQRRAELEALAVEHGLSGRVHFLGWRCDLERVYADLDVTVLTSRNEGSPVALIEAMAAGRPVVATRVGGVGDVVEDGVTGHLVPSGDAEAVAAAIVDLLSDPKRRQTMGEAGREQVVPRFAMKRLLADLDGLYRDLLGARGIHAGQ